MMTLATLHALLPGAALFGDTTTRILRVHSDTRTLQPGDLFVALKGERFDAHDFLPQAKAAGAAAVLAERGLEGSGLPGLQVADSLAALQQLARAWRAGLMLPLIAVTGSNGKTTVTQMIAAILRTWVGDAALATAGNFNNHIGVPLTLLRLTASTRAAVVELGMNHPGEIAELATIAAPTVALVNNAQREHQEFMGTVEAVARENGAVIAALPPSGTAVFPADEEFAPLWRELAGTRRVLRFGPGGDVTADGRWETDHWRVRLHAPLGDTAFALRVAGAHNLRNAMAAAACALAAGAPLAAVQAGLESFAPVKGRSAAQRLAWRGRDITLVDDSYNANPDSVRAAIDVLAGLPGPRWLVLGDMGEVGDRGPAFHAEVGAYARERGLEAFWCAGAMGAESAGAYGPGARHWPEVPALLAALPEAPAAASILVKGSRFMQMERVVQAIRAEAAPCC
jgi:UDP-N-acetylmuramoyl-tripeptide--D-alanyl-D-alanine ligase